MLLKPSFCLFQVLVIGGGDGGVIREVSKHPAVESIVQCEIDEVSNQGAKKVSFFPFGQAVASMC